MMEMLVEPPPANSLKVQTFADLLRIINTHPEWREQLVRALFPDIDIVKAIQELIKSQEAVLALLQELTIRVTKLEESVAVLKTDVAGLKTDVGSLKGIVFEGEYRTKAAAIFGRYIRRGRDMTNDVADLLADAEAAGNITASEYEQVLTSDLLWGGALRLGGGQVVVTVEASWRAMVNDLERAINRAAILRRIGLIALPVVAAQEWDDDLVAMARQQRVVVARKGLVDSELWQAAMLA